VRRRKAALPAALFAGLQPAIEQAFAKLKAHLQKSRRQNRVDDLWAAIANLKTFTPPNAKTISFTQDTILNDRKML